MTVVIKKRTTKKEIETLLQRFKKKRIKKKSLRSVFGIYKVEEDAVELQKKLRNEWD